MKTQTQSKACPKCGRDIALCPCEFFGWPKPAQTEQRDKLPDEAMHVCPNCEQYQYAGRNGYYDCFNECASKGFAPKLPNIKLEAEQRDTPKRGIDYNVYPPSATSDRKGWAVTIGGEYVKVAPFATRSDAETYAQTEVLKKRKATEQREELGARWERERTEQRDQAAEEAACGATVEQRDTAQPSDNGEGYDIALNVSRGDGSKLVALILQRDQYKANADKSAKALAAAERLAEAATDLLKYPKSETAAEDMREALAAWERAQK